MAVRTVNGAHLEGNFLLHPFAVGFPEAAFHIVDNSLELAFKIAVHAVAFALDFNFSAFASVKKNINCLFGQILHRNVEGEIIFLRKSFIIICGDSAFVIIPAGSVNSAFTDGKILVRKDKIRIHLHENTETGAFFTGTERIVEREHSRGEFINGCAVIRACVVLGEHKILAADDIHNSKSAALLHYGFERIRKTGTDFRLYNKAVNDYFDGVFFVLLKLDFLRKIVNYSVDPDADKTAFSCGIKLFYIFAFSAPDDGSHKLDFGAFRKFQHLVNNLVDGLLFYLSSADRAMGNADSCIEQTEIVINLRNGSDGGTGVFARVLLVDGNCR